MNFEWKEEKGFLTTTFKFKDFKGALNFVNKVGELAEKIQHHPDICIKDYNSVTISTTTHDAGKKVTEKDHKLAVAIKNLL